MKKTTKNIIIALAALLVLGAAVAVLLLTMPEAEVEENTANTTTGLMDVIVDKTVADVKNITMKNSVSGEDWTLIPVKSSENAEANDTFTFEGWEDEAVLQSNVADVAADFHRFRPTKEIENVEDLSSFGLAGDGECKVVTTYNDGTKDTFIVGYEAGETYGRYVLYEDKVYIVATSIYLTDTKNDFINTTVLEIPNMTDYVSENNIAIETLLEEIRFSGTNYEEDILVEYSDDSILYYAIAEPIFAGTSSRIDEIITQLQSIQAVGVAEVNVTEDKLGVYGLDEPSTMIEFTLNFETHTIRLGSLVNGVYSLMIDDNKTVYMVSEDSVNTWAGVTLFDLRDSYVRLANIKEVETLVVTSAQGTESYDITRIKNEEKSTEAIPFYDLEVERDGTAVEYDSMYQPFYQSTLAVSILNEEIREPSGEPILTIRYEYFSDVGNKDDEVAFYMDPENDRRCIATLNGVPSGVVRYSNVEEILAKKALIANYEAVEKD